MQAISSEFNVDFSLSFPSYSELLEKLSSRLLDKSSEIVVRIYPYVNLTMSQELYTYIMRCQCLNFAFTDGKKEEMEFSQVNEIFQSTEGLLFTRTKIEVDNDFLIKLIQDGKELVEMKIRSTKRKRGPDNLPIAKSREMVRVDQLLDGSMKLYA